MGVQYKMRENRDINVEGILENVEVFAWREGRALVSRVTIDQGDGMKTSVPYFGGLTDEEISEMAGKPAKFTEYRRALVSQERYQELECAGICAGTGWLAQSDVKAMLRAYYPERK